VTVVRRLLYALLNRSNCEKVCRTFRGLLRWRRSHGGGGQGGGSTTHISVALTDCFVEHFESEDFHESVIFNESRIDIVHAAAADESENRRLSLLRRRRVQVYKRFICHRVARRRQRTIYSFIIGSFRALFFMTRYSQRRCRVARLSSSHFGSVYCHCNCCCIYAIDFRAGPVRDVLMNSPCIINTGIQRRRAGKINGHVDVCNAIDALSE
jgi:hypothetical protein